MRSRRRRRIPAAQQKAAVALAYPKGEIAPKVVAKGYGDTAERIIQEAKKADIFVHDAPDLFNLLVQIDMDDHIPPELYRAIAEILAFVYSMEKAVDQEPQTFEAWKEKMAAAVTGQDDEEEGTTGPEL